MSIKNSLKVGLASLIIGFSSLYCGGGSSGGSNGNVNPPVNGNAPVVTITSPVSGSSYKRGVSIDFNADAYDSNGTITSKGWSPVQYILPNGLTDLVGSSAIAINSTLGQKILTAYAADNEGLRTEKSVNIEVVNNTPIVDAGANQSVTLDQLLVLNGSARDIDGTIIKYEWDFNNDGIYDWSSTTTGSTSISYPTAGAKTAKLRVTDNDGGQAEDTSIIMVSENANLSPVTNITVPSGNLFQIYRVNSFNMCVKASDSDGYIKELGLYQDKTSPYQSFSLLDLITVYNQTELCKNNINVPKEAPLGSYKIVGYSLDDEALESEDFLEVKVLNNPPVAHVIKNVTLDSNTDYLFDFTTNTIGLVGNYPPASSDKDGTITQYCLTIPTVITRTCNSTGKFIINLPDALTDYLFQLEVIDNDGAVSPTDSGINSTN